MPLGVWSLVRIATGGTFDLRRLPRGSADQRRGNVGFSLAGSTPAPVSMALDDSKKKVAV